MKISSELFKIGIGQDSHKFSTLKRPLIIGGIKILDNEGFEADSDGDILLHALCNAISSALGGNSLGTWANRMYKNKKISDSKEYIKEVLKIMYKRKYTFANLSVSIEAKKPRFSETNIVNIKKSLAKILKIEINNIGITLTSGDDLTSFGKGLGMNVFCAVLLYNNG